MDKETPITKYLAALERRQSLLYDSPVVDISKKLNFDDTFLMGSSGKHEQSLLHISPAIPAKRKRFSLHDHENDEEFQKKSTELERLLRQTQADLIDSRALITKLEHQIMEIKKQHMEKIISLEKSNAEVRSKSRNAIEHTERLEQQLVQAEKRDTEIKEKVRNQAEAHSIKSRVIKEQLNKLQRENVELREKLNNVNVKSQNLVRKISNDLSETERGAEKWIMETQMLKEQLELKDQQLKKYQQEQLAIKLKEIQAFSSQNNEVESKSSETHSLINSLEERVKKYENLFCKQQNENRDLLKAMKKIQDENSILRTTMRSELVLKEQISSLENQLNTARKDAQKHESIESENVTVKDELNKWMSVANKIDSSCNTPLEFEAFIRKTQNMLLEFKHENSDLQYKYDNVNRIVSKQQTESVSLREQNKSFKEEKDKLTLDMKKLTRRMGLIAKDRDGLKGLKESYEQEVTGLMSSPLQERISQLESVVAEYETLLKEDANTKKSCTECENRKTLVNQLRSDLENKKRELAEVHAQYSQASQPNPDDTTDGVKIVAFSMNPSALTVEARIKELNSENERLKEKLKEFEEQSTLNIADPAFPDEKKKLEDQYKVLERKHEILTEAYEYETQMLNCAITRLFGFHITLVQEPIRQIRLQSIYSHSTNTDDAFIFQEAENHDMMLLETPILNSFREDIDRFLIGMNSIPAFVACITITYVQSSANQPSYDDMSLIPLSQDSQPSQPRSSGDIVNVRVESTHDEEDDDDDVAEVEEEEEPMYEDEESDHNEDYDQDDEDDDDVVTIDDD